MHVALFLGLLGRDAASSISKRGSSKAVAFVCIIDIIDDISQSPLQSAECRVQNLGTAGVVNHDNAAFTVILISLVYILPLQSCYKCTQYLYVTTVVRM